MFKIILITQNRIQQENQHVIRFTPFHLAKRYCSILSVSFIYCSIYRFFFPSKELFSQRFLFFLSVSVQIPTDRLKLQARGPVPGPDINYTGPREVLLEFVILVL